jgi:hypothetical protein
MLIEALEGAGPSAPRIAEETSLAGAGSRGKISRLRNTRLRGTATLQFGADQDRMSQDRFKCP